MAGPMVVFLGPSLDKAEAAALCPGADLRRPARKGDLLSAVVDDGASVIGLIDGEFDQSLAVWHKEVLYALQAGVAVLGASSMGALRAAELSDWGMRGVGRVYERFASGDLIDDDEVALVYVQTDDAYRKLSEPMVNIRESFLAGARAGVVGPDLVDTALVVAKKLHFRDRSYRRVLLGLRDRGAAAAEVDRLGDWLAEHAVDAKADDARELLSILARGDVQPGPPARLHRTVGFDTLFRRERALPGADAELLVDEIAARFRAGAPDGAAGYAAALDRGFLLMMGELFDIDPTEAETDAALARWRSEHGLDGEGALSHWLEVNRTSRTDLRALARGEAVRAVLHQWLLGALATEGDAPTVVDHLRLTNRLAPWIAPDGDPSVVAAEGR